MTIERGISQSNIEKYEILVFVHFVNMICLKGPFEENKSTCWEKDQMKHFYWF